MGRIQIDISCNFRKPKADDPDRTAICGLLQLLANSDSVDATVPRAACEVCVSQRRSGHVLTPVFWSQFYLALEESADANGRLLSLQHLAEDAVVEGDLGVSRPSLPCCDVVVCVTESSDTVQASIRSILDQQNASVLLHLVDDGGNGQEVIEQFRQFPEVVVHRNQTTQGLLPSIQDLIPVLKSQFVALHDQYCIARPMHIACSVRQLEEMGGEIAGASFLNSSGAVAPSVAKEASRRIFPWQTLTMRIGTVVDMGGFCDDHFNADEFLGRAIQEERSITVVPMVTVECLDEHSSSSHRTPESKGLPQDQIRGRRLALPTVECDVILPFRDHLDYLQEALNGLLNQVNCNPVIHLVDDDSRGSCDDFLERFKDHPQVRIYRNTRNIGQFTSFNNILPWVESGFVAIQDSDDVSQPERLWRSVNALKLAKADIFGCAVELFGASATVTPNRQGEPELQERSEFRYSRFPIGSANNYFLENPTAVFRVSSFESLGGFADFGTVERNRASLDTEFYIRAHHAGARIIVSRQALLRYRCHPESATQDGITGWGTNARIIANEEVLRRGALMRSGMFDPRVFGALGKYQSVTRRLN